MKTFVLDTNVLLFDADSIFKFEEHQVVIPITVIEEVDHFKKQMDELGRNARRFSRYLDELRSVGSLTAGVPVNELGGQLRVELYNDVVRDGLHRKAHLDFSVYDNRILAAAFHNKAILVTKDVNLRVKADALGLVAQDYENSKVDFEALYSGVREEQGFFKNLEQYTPPLLPNEFVFENSTMRELLRFNGEGIYPVVDNQEAWGLTPRNDEQRCAMDLLLDDSIKLVTLVGKAGTGKTLMAIAAGLKKVTDEFVYRKVLVSRPVMPMGKDIGFLPGTIEEKLNPYMQPIFDNVEFLMSGYAASESPTQKKIAKKASRKKTEEKDEKEKEAGSFSKGYLELVNAGIIEIEPLLYIRGRSIPNQYLIVDEAQSLTPHEVKTIITRAGEGTKIVFTGDPHQIDNPYVDASSNGLTYIVEKFKNEKIAGHVTLTKGERSELAELASNLL